MVAIPSPSLHSFATSFLFVTLALQFISSLSLPYLPTLYTVGISFTGSRHPSIGHLNGTVHQLTLGIWAYCGKSDVDNLTTCVHVGRSYSVSLEDPVSKQVSSVHASWTRGLTVHPVATGVTTVGFLLASWRNSSSTLSLILLLTIIVATILTVIAIVTECALRDTSLDELHHDLTSVDATAAMGPGFWLLLISLVFLLLASLLLMIDRRRRTTRIMTSKNESGAP